MRDSLYKTRTGSVVCECTTNISDVSTEEPISNGNRSPHGFEQFVLGHQPLRIFGQILQNRERLWREANVLRIISQPLICSVEHEGAKAKIWRARHLLFPPMG
jgi:hypothetical protein